MKKNSLISKDLTELKKDLADKQEMLRAFRFGGAGSRVKNVKAGRTTRHEIAQILTEIRRRHIADKKEQENLAQTMQQNVAQTMQENLAKASK